MMMILIKKRNDDMGRKKKMIRVGRRNDGDNDTGRKKK